MSNNAIISQLTKDRDHALALVGVHKKEKLSLDVDHTKLLEELETLTKDYKSLESKFATLSKSSGQPQGEAPKEKEVEVFNSCCDHVDELASLRWPKTTLLEVNSLQEEALDEYFRLSKERVPCCNDEEEIGALERNKAKILEINAMQEESLMEYFWLSKEKVVCCDHEEEIAALERNKAKLLEINTMQEEALKEYFPLSKDRITCCNHEEEIAALEGHKHFLLKINSLQEEALKEHFRLNKEKEVEVFDITHPFPEHEDEVNRLKLKTERLRIHALYLERALEAKDGVKESSSNKGGVAIKPKKKRRRTKKKKNKNNVGIAREAGPSSPRRGGVPDPTTRGYAGANNPSHVLFIDYYGRVRARFVGPYEENIDWTIWVPKPLVTNMQGPIEKWVPKSKN